MTENLDCAACGRKIKEGTIKDRVKVTVGKLTYTPETWDICAMCRLLARERRQTIQQIKAILQQSRKVCRSEMQDYFSGNFWSELTEKEREGLNSLIDNCTQFLRYIGHKVEG